MPQNLVEARAYGTPERLRRVCQDSSRPLRQCWSHIEVLQYIWKKFS